MHHLSESGLAEFKDLQDNSKILFWKFYNSGNSDSDGLGSGGFAVALPTLCFTIYGLKLLSKPNPIPLQYDHV